MNSIVIDTCVMRLYDNPLDPAYAKLFQWLTEKGTLCITQKLLVEYLGTGNKNITTLISHLSKRSEDIRVIKFPKKDIESFKLDNKYQYTCNYEDQYHCKLVFLSTRKKLISQDKKIINDVNGFKKVDGIKPKAELKPAANFYDATA